MSYYTSLWGPEVPYWSQQGHYDVWEGEVEGSLRYHANLRLYDVPTEIRMTLPNMFDQKIDPRRAAGLVLTEISNRR